MRTRLNVSHSSAVGLAAALITVYIQFRIEYSGTDDVVFTFGSEETLIEATAILGRFILRGR